MTSKWRVTGADANTGRDFSELIEARNGREAQRLVQERGIVTSSVVPVHDDSAGSPAIAEDSSFLTRSDWRKLEWTIIKGVCGGVLLLYLLNFVTLLVLYFVLFAMRVRDG